MGGITLGRLDLLARQLPRRHRIEPLDALRHVAVGDAFHLEHVQPAEGRDLVEGERRVLDQPNGRRFGHQGPAVAHDGFYLRRPAVRRAKRF